MPKQFSSDKNDKGVLSQEELLTAVTQVIETIDYDFNFFTMLELFTMHEKAYALSISGVIALLFHLASISEIPILIKCPAI